MKLTPTFPANILPVRSGVYLTTHIDNETGLPVFNTKGYSLFDATSKIWGCNYRNVDVAAENPEFEFAWQNKSWQGLAEEPKP
jgi:hypothetical protein